MSNMMQALADRILHELRSASFAGNTIGAAVFFGNISDIGLAANGVPTNADVTVIAHFTDGTDYPAWSGNLA